VKDATLQSSLHEAKRTLATVSFGIMDTSRLMAMLQDYLESHQDLPALIHKLAQHMQGARVSLTTSEADILESLDFAASNSFVPSWLRMIHEIGGDGLHGRQLARRIRAILENTDFRKAHKGTLLEGVFEDLQPFTAHARSLLNALEKMNVLPDRLPAGTSEIGVLFPSAVIKDLEELADEVHELDRHLRVFAELAGTTGSLPLRRIDTGSFNIFALADPAVGGLFAAVLVGLVTLVKQVAEIRKLAAETRKINTEVAEQLEKQANDERQTGIARVAERCLQSTDISDLSRRNELTLSLSKSIAYVDAKMQMNVVFEVRASASTVSGDGNEEAALKLIRQSGNSLAEIALREWQLLLPANGEKPAGKPRE
jgi:hypothetical protein